MEIEIIECIKELLCQYGKASVPGMGTFYTSEIPSEISSDGEKISPPSVKISFSRHSGSTDNVLVRYLAVRNDISEGNALGIITRFAFNIRKKWEEGDIKWEGFGTLTNNEKGEIDFVAEENAIKQSFLFGLDETKLPDKDGVENSTEGIQENLSPVENNESTVEDYKVEDEKSVEDLLNYIYTEDNNEAGTTDNHIITEKDVIIENTEEGNVKENEYLEENEDIEYYPEERYTKKTKKAPSVAAQILYGIIIGTVIAIFAIFAMYALGIA